MPLPPHSSWFDHPNNIWWCSSSDVKYYLNIVTVHVCRTPQAQCICVHVSWQHHCNPWFFSLVTEYKNWHTNGVRCTTNE
jgi:hypothetical protein